ncbi:MAG: penicillin acylase family protein, partial [Actinomycetota bacterium]
GIKWGSIHRVELLQDAMHRYLDGPRKARLSDLVDVIRGAATRDARAVYLRPKMVRWGAASDAPEADAALAAVKAWVKDGAHRLNRNWKDGDDQEDNGVAAAVFDAWYADLVHGVFDDELGADAYDLVGTPVSDRAMRHDFSSYLGNLFSKRGRRAYARNYCDDMGTPGKESCKDQVAKSLTDALTALKEDQGDDPTAWTTDAWMIEFASLGLGSADPIPWQNRGTHNHVVEILRKAP